LNTLKSYSKDLFQTIKNLGLTSSKYDPFMTALGGDVFIIDSYVDLAGVMAGQRPDIVQKSNKGLYVMIVVLNNNSGGPTYCVGVELYESWLESMPKHIQELMREITSHA